MENDKMGGGGGREKNNGSERLVDGTIRMADQGENWDMENRKAPGGNSCEF